MKFDFDFFKTLLRKFKFY